MRKKGLGFILGIFLIPLLLYACMGVESLIDTIIDAFPFLIFLTYVKNAAYFSILIITPVVLPIVMWKRNKTFSLTLIISTILFGLLFIPGMVYKVIDRNDSLAQSTLRALSTASESFADDNGAYPNVVADLTKPVPPYIAKNYCETEVSGFHYSCEFNSEGYRFSATPVEIGVSGTRSYTIVTGGIFEEK